MGWHYEHSERADMIRELTEEHNGARCLAHTAVGNVLWTVWEHAAVGRWIGCDLMERAGGRWGHKPMDEAMGPCYYTCPLRYLEMVPDVACPEWRDQVRAYHAERTARREIAQNAQPGQVIYLKGTSIPFVTVTGTEPLRGTYAGDRYQVAERHIHPDQTSRQDMAALARPVASGPQVER